jgi:hypothetical protein
MKKTLFIIGASLLLISLSACGAKEVSTSRSSEKVSTSTSSSSTATTSSESETSALEKFSDTQISGLIPVKAKILHFVLPAIVDLTHFDISPTFNELHQFSNSTSLGIIAVY